MLGWLFRSDPKAALEKKYRQKLEEAAKAMNEKGDRALHATLTAEAEAIGEQLDALRDDA